jgi:hypothetical protein
MSKTSESITTLKSITALEKTVKKLEAVTEKSVELIARAGKEKPSLADYVAKQLSEIDGRIPTEDDVCMLWLINIAITDILDEYIKKIFDIQKKMTEG